jgi:hypothetical protein
VLAATVVWRCFNSLISELIVLKVTAAAAACVVVWHEATKHCLSVLDSALQLG